ncbi:MAG: hypothetical protein ACYCYO_13965 [Bacilli bacterium]
MGRLRNPLPQTAPLWTRNYLLLDVVSFLFFTSFYLLTILPDGARRWVSTVISPT